MARQEEATLILRIKKVGEEALGKARDLLEDLGKAAFAAATAVVGFAGAAIKAYADQEQATNKLNQAMVTQGIFTAELSKKYHDQAAALQTVTTFADENIIAAQAQLQSMLGQKEVSIELTKATLDLAAAKGIDLVSAAEMVGKSIGTSTNALARQGIEIDSTASKTEKMTQIIDQINGRWGGQAEALAKGTGAFIIMKNAVGELMEQIGERLAPDLIKAANAITEFSSNTSKATPFVDGFINALKLLLNVGAGVKFVLTALGTWIGGAFATALEVMSSVMDRKFSQAKDQLGTFFGQMKDDQIANMQQLNDETTAIDNMFTQEAVLREQAKQDQINAVKNAAVVSDDTRKNTQITKEQLHQAKLLGIEVKGAKNRADAQLMIDKEKERARAESLSTIATLQDSNNKVLAGIGKAAALTQIAIEAPIGVSRALAAFPPPFNFAAAAAVGAAFAVQAAKVAGIKMADGGIVRSTPGGVHAIIGEGGRDEAVIPLENGQVPGSGKTTINFNGPILGDESQARRFAMMLDKELLKLRRGNESVAFDADFT